MRKKLQVKLICLLCTFILSLNADTSLAQWIPMGGDMIGAAAHNHSGRAVNISNNGFAVVMGAPGNGIVSSYQGAARVFEWNGSTWQQKGATILGDNPGDQSGNGVDIDRDGSTFMVGAPYDNGTSTDEGQVRVFEWNGNAWIQKGTDIFGEAPYDSLGYAVCMSADGNTIAAGSSYNDGTGVNAGHVRVFEWNGNTWVQKGGDIDGEAAGDRSGWSVSMTADGNTVASGAIANSGGGPGAGHVRVFSWNGSAWQQKGGDIDGLPGDASGWSISLSNDGDKVALSAIANSSSATYAGTIRAYEWDGSTWVQRGTDINGLNAYDEWGWTVSLSSSGDTMASAAREGSYIRIFKWNGTGWVQLGSNITFSYYTGQVSLCDDGSKAAVGDPLDNTGGLASGRVRVYSDFPTGIVQNNFIPGLLVYPNPSHGIFQINLGKNYSDVVVTIKNIFGQVIASHQYSTLDMLQYTIDNPPGIYIAEITADSHYKAVVKICKQ